MRGVREALIWACLFITTIAAHNVTRRDTSGGSKRVVCYYTNWSVYRPGTAKFNPQNINPYLCTHLIYAFGGLTRENGLRPYDKYQDIEQGGYAKFTGLKTYNKQLKTMLAIGGWNEGSTRFSPLVASEVRRKEFVKNVVRFLRQNHFDGLDLDWEYPAFRDGGKPRDRDNYAQLVQELREEFDRESSKTGRPRLLLTMAVPAGIEYIDKGYDIPKLNTYLDFMNILSYDYHSSFEPSVNHHSPLYPLEEEGEYNFDAQLSIDYTINHYLKLGADQDKLVLGIPTYGRSYTLFNPDSTEIGAPADGPGEQGDATREKGYLAYYEICENLEADSEWKVVQPNPKAMGPYAYKGNQWVGYDDEEIVRKKARYVTEKGLGGIMYWAIDNDDFRGKCHGRPYPLIEAGKEAMLASSGTSNELDSTSSKGKGRPKPRVTTEEPPISNSGGGSSRPSSGKRRRPSTKTKTQEKRVSTTTSTTPAYKYPTSTPEPPTTPDPGSDFKCEDEGFFPHPRDCKKYFWCLDSGPSNLGIVAHQFTCPSGLFFNKAADSCDYTRNVVCNTKTTVEPVKTTTTKPATTTTLRSVRIASTSTTTTLAPEEEEEEYEEYDEEPEEDPKAIKELIDLIKKLGGIENLEKQLHLDGSNKKEVTNSVTPPAISKKLYNRVLSQANVRGNSNANFYNPPSTRSSTPHTLIYKNRGRQNEGLENLPEVTAVRQEKPQYVTIRRERPTTPIPVENPVENEDEEEEEDEEDADDADEGKKEGGKTSAREYVTIRRDRPVKRVEEEVTTPKYVSIRRPRPTKLPEVEEDINDIPVALVEVTSEASSPSVKEESPVSRKKLSPFAPRTIKVGSVLESFRRKKKEEEVTVTTEEVNEEVATVTTEASKPKVSTTTARSLRRPGGSFYANNRVRSRSTTTSTTTEVPAKSVSLRPARRPQQVTSASRLTVNRRRKYGDTTASTVDVVVTTEASTTESIVTTLPTDDTVTVEPTRKFSFPRRRTKVINNTSSNNNKENNDANETSNSNNIKSKRVQLTVKAAIHHVVDSQNEPSTINGIKSQNPVEVIDETSSSLPDLANDAVVAIHNLATTPTRGTFRRKEVYSTFAAQTATTPIPPRISTTAAPFFPRRGTAVYVTSTSPPQLPQRDYDSFKPRPFTKITSASQLDPQSSSLEDYEYYDHGEGVFANPTTGKVKIHSDGYIECLDQGNFPHPFSCKKFISCAKMENTDVLGWEYTCPRHLSFDPIGGICNWSAGLGCKE